jgi:hypothetical protein
MMMQPYKGCFIEGSALLVHPFSQTVTLRQRSGARSFSSGVEVTRFQIHQFAVSIKELAVWLGLEVARLVDECLPQRQS